MSYCRFSSSDIYLFSHVEGYICCNCCILTPKTRRTIFTKGLKTGEHPIFSKGVDGCTKCEGEGCESCCMHHDSNFEHYQDAIQHVKEHIAAGHHVPGYVIPRLERDCRIDKWSPPMMRSKNRKRRVMMLLNQSGRVHPTLDVSKFYMTDSQQYVSPWMKSKHYCMYHHPRMISVHIPVRKARKPLARKFRHLRKMRNL